MTAMPETDLIERLSECAEMVEGGKQSGLTKFWHVETAKLTSQTCSEAAAALSEKDRRIGKLEAVNARLLLEAQCHSMEARGANATIHEAYQAVTEGKGEPGSWNGAVPIKEELDRLRARLAFCEAALEQISAGPMFTVTDRDKWIEWAIETARAAKETSHAE